MLLPPRSVSKRFSAPGDRDITHAPLPCNRSHLDRSPVLAPASGRHIPEARPAMLLMVRLQWSGACVTRFRSTNNMGWAATPTFHRVGSTRRSPLISCTGLAVASELTQAQNYSRCRRVFLSPERNASRLSLAGITFSPQPCCQATAGEVPSHGHYNENARTPVAESFPPGFSHTPGVA